MQVKKQVRNRYGTTDWFRTGKEVHQGCILSPGLFNFYAEYIMRNAGLDEAQAGIKIAGRNINNLRYAIWDFFKKIRDTKGTFHIKLGTTKDRKGMELREAEDLEYSSWKYISWKDWYWSWSSNTLATWCEVPTHWKRPWCRERLKTGEGTTEDEMVG